MNFIAIDFETADYKRDSACAIGIVRVEDGIITDRVHHLIKPPRPNMIFSYLHGIYWKDVKDQPDFGETWKKIEHYFRKADFVAAHNVTFDRSVLRACCEAHNIELPELEFKCTMKLSRDLWNIYPTKLNNVCDHFNIALDHHNVVSDTEACAQIMIRAAKQLDEPKEEDKQRISDASDNGIRMWQLGSSSQGNSTLIWNDETSILIDCGFSQLYMRKQLERVNKDLSDISAVLITHIHSDHINPAILNKFIRDKIPVYCHINLVNDFKKKFEAARRLNKIGMLNIITDVEFNIGNFRVRAFGVPHDSAGGCFGYNISGYSSGELRKISLATDIGYLYDLIEDQFIDSDILMIESNHDIEMLDNSRRTEALKERIKSIGHLSNEECAELLLNIIKKSSKLPERILLAHISQECNTNEQAVEVNKTYLEDNGIKDIPIIPLLPSPLQNVFHL